MATLKLYFANAFNLVDSVRCALDLLAAKVPALVPWAPILIPSPITYHLSS